MAGEPNSRNGSKPKVTVITPFLNAEKFIVEAIECVLAQTFRDFEYILVDDGSSDTSTAISLSYASRFPAQIRYVDHEGHANRGLPASRNLGVALARGELIALLDADDVWDRNKLADQARIMDAHPDLGMVCGATLYWRSWNGGTDELIASGHVQDRPVNPPEASLHVYPLGAASAPCPSDLMIRKAIALSVGGFEEAFTGPLQRFEDQAFLSKLYLSTPVYFAATQWLKYRIHSESIVATVEASGKKEDARRAFFQWLARYFESVDGIDERVLTALVSARQVKAKPRFPFSTLPKKFVRWWAR